MNRNRQNRRRLRISEKGGGAYKLNRQISMRQGGSGFLTEPFFIPYIVLSMSAAFTVPDDRKDLIMDLMNKINRACRGSHMYFSHEKKNVVLLSGIMLENGSVDKAELKRVFPVFMGNGFRMIPIVYEQLTSTASPETLLFKALGSYPGTSASV